MMENVKNKNRIGLHRNKKVYNPEQNILWTKNIVEQYI